MIRVKRAGLRNSVLLGVAITAVFALTGCGKHEKPYFIYMPDMYWTKGLKYQQPGMRAPVAGTIPRDHYPIPASMTPAEAGKAYSNPLRASLPVLKRGKQVYDNTCVVCHGPGGEGDGYIVPKFPRPPSLISEKIRGMPDGTLYHIISNGQNLMSGYASQIQREDRWAVVHYIRALDRAKNPTKEDLKTVSN